MGVPGPFPDDYVDLLNNEGSVKEFRSVCPCAHLTLVLFCFLITIHNGNHIKSSLVINNPVYKILEFVFDSFGCRNIFSENNIPITATKTKRNFNIKSCIRDEIPYCNSIQPRQVFHLLYDIERSSRRVMVRGFLFAVARRCTSEKTTDPDYLSVLIVFMGKIQITLRISESCLLCHTIQWRIK